MEIYGNVFGLFKFCNSTKILSQNILIVIFVSVHLHQFLPIKKLNGECCCLDLVSSCCLNCCIDDWLYWDGDRRTYCQLDDKWAGYTGTNELLPVGQKTVWF